MRSGKIHAILLISLFIFLGILLRIEPIVHWHDNPDEYFSNNIPVLSTLDGYFYLNIAKEIGENRYSSTDDKRAYPQGLTRSVYPPLLPLLIHYSSSIFHITLNWVSIWLPVFLGICLLIPVYLFSKYYGGTVACAGALAFAAFSPSYLLRTSLGRLDTDCLNIVLPLFCAYFFMLFGLGKTKKRYIYFSCALLFFLTFLWWWDMTPAAVIILSLSPLAVALLFHYRPGKNEAVIFYIIIAAMIAAILLSIDTSRLVIIVKSISMQLSYISKESSGLFPSMGISNMEQQGLSLFKTLTLVTANYAVLIITGCGFILLCLQQKSKIFYLLPLTIIGCFSFFYAQRFTIFLTPLFAISFGYFFSTLTAYVQKRVLLYLLYSLTIISLMWSSYDLIRNRQIMLKGNIINGMQMIKEITPRDAVIWSWWDEGHPLVYWAERATLSDGMIHGGARSVFTALPLVETDFRLAANFMRFYVTHGIPGINQFLNATGKDSARGIAQLKTLLSLGTTDGQDFLRTLSLNPESDDYGQLNKIDYYYPEHTPPIYLFIDERMIKVFRWIYWYGSWNTTNRTGTPTLPVLRIEKIQFNQGQPTDNSRISLDFDQGILAVNHALPYPSKMKSITTIETRDLYNLTFNREPKEQYRHIFSDGIQSLVSSTEQLTNIGSYDVLLDIPQQKITIMDNKLAKSVMFQLFTYGDFKSHKYFIPVDTTSEHYQIWKVLGDRPE